MKRLMVVALSASLLLPALAQANDNITVSQPISVPQTDLSAVFSASGDDLQIVVLSDKEMAETEGAVAPVILGGAIGLGSYVIKHKLKNEPMTLKGAAFATGVGAISGGVGGALSKAAGGGIAGAVWKGNAFSISQGVNSYGTYKKW